MDYLMMTVNEKLKELRRIMERENLDAYIVSGSDPHNSEYLPEAWQQRRWISGFTGSYGTVVVTPTAAGLWTDSRYFIQAEKELAGSEIKLHKLRVPGAVDYPEWLAATLPTEAKVGFDGFCTPASDVRMWKSLFSLKQIEAIEKVDLLGEIWMDRPTLPDSKAFLLEEKYAGTPARQKLNQLRRFLDEKEADYIILNVLDEIAWLYNIRGFDISYNPLLLSYAIVGKTKAWLFVKQHKVPSSVASELKKDGIELMDYHHVLLFLDGIEQNSRFVADLSTLNQAIYNKLSSKFQVQEEISPVVLWKSVKNEIEIAGFRKACITDGIALVRFLYWLEFALQQTEIRETDAVEKLQYFRSLSDDYVSDSFHTISAYGKHAALPHYIPLAGQDSLLDSKGLYLLDSGAQYRYGTTDITRTIPLGELSALEKEDYTLVLKGMIALGMSVFPKGTTGSNLDVVARYPLWQKMRNYGHGTGHGIGHFLCVHEGPQDIRQAWRNQPFLAGMVTSDEPGMYREGAYGIRHENMLLCCPLEKNEFGEWLGFETLSMCYFDTSAICPELLSREEKEWLNAYHKRVYETLHSVLSDSEAKWLKNKTRPLEV